MSAQLAQALKSTLRIDYENDTGPGDEGFWEWWSVIDEATGETLCKCDDEATAKRILAALAAHEAAPQAQAPQDWLHLKPYGYAPGNYMSRCSDCGQTPAMDKRATRCRPCAEAAFCKTQQAPQQEPVASIDDVAANVRVCFGEGAAAFNEGVDALAAEYKRCAAPQQAQAPGWQLVPVEPTPEMESECMGLLMCESLVYERPHGGLSVETIAPVKLWAAMLKAAPQQGSNT